MKPINESVIIICSIIRDAEYGLLKNKPVIQAFCKMFNDYKIVIFENDSKDRTKLLLSNWAKEEGNHAHFIMEDYHSVSTLPPNDIGETSRYFCEKRISKMVSLRNQYMDYIEYENFNADYLMVIDLDIARIKLEALLSSFNTSIDWDAVTAYGYSISPNFKLRYHDAYALTEYGDENNVQTEDRILELSQKYKRLKPYDAWIRVFSAFGGVAIYKFEAIKGLKYQLIKNNDKRVEVKCEHFSIYKQMSEKGFNKVYINPLMKLYYESITHKIKNGIIKRMKFLTNNTRF